MSTDPFHLARFVEAQESIYDDALRELRGARKKTHWMWFIFPQIIGLGQSSTAQFYSLKSADEARAYLEHPVLGSRLLECTATVEGIEKRGIAEVFGSPDDMKFRSCMTLFAQVAPKRPQFERLITKYFQGQPDERTLQILQDLKGAK